MKIHKNYYNKVIIINNLSMTKATIIDISEKLIPSNSYKAEELLKLLMNVLDYNIEIEEFSSKENKNLLKDSKIDKISELID